MMYYDRTDTSGGIDPDKSNRSKECMICPIGFLNIDLNFKILHVMIGMIWKC